MTQTLETLKFETETLTFEPVIFFRDTNVCVCQLIHADNTPPPQNTAPPPPPMAPPHLGHLHYSSVVTAGLLAGAISQKYSANWLRTVRVLGH
jgi:hypothetical protein